MVINISAKAGQGKTRMTFKLIRSFLQEKKKVVYISDELTTEDVITYLDGARFSYGLRFNDFLFLSRNWFETRSFKTLLGNLAQAIDERCTEPDVIAIDCTGMVGTLLMAAFEKVYPKAVIVYTTQEASETPFTYSVDTLL